MYEQNYVMYVGFLIIPHELSLSNGLLFFWIYLFCISKDPNFAIFHYENTPIQIYWKFYNQKMKIFG